MAAARACCKQLAPPQPGGGSKQRVRYHKRCQEKHSHTAAYHPVVEPPAVLSRPYVRIHPRHRGGARPGTIPEGT